MSKAAEEASQKITELKSQLEAEKAEKSQLDQELIQHKLDRETAQADLATAERLYAEVLAARSKAFGADDARTPSPSAPSGSRRRPRWTRSRSARNPNPRRAEEVRGLSSEKKNGDRPKKNMDTTDMEPYRHARVVPCFFPPIQP